MRDGGGDVSDEKDSPDGDIGPSHEKREGPGDHRWTGEDKAGDNEGERRVGRGVKC